jgi:uncharacterized protein (DUF302 family)
MTLETSSYAFRIRTNRPYADLVQAVREALKVQGFGVLTEIDVRKVMKEKTGADFRPYVILGACNPQFAHQALAAEPEIGLLLPCNLIVYEEDGGSVVSAMDPVKVLTALIDRPGMAEIARQVRDRLEAALRAAASPS